VLNSWRDGSLAELLAAHGLAGLPERDFPNDGWSGATFTTVERDGHRFILKRVSLATDWIARATDDAGRREAWIATNGRAASLPIPYLGAAADGDDAVILSPDLSVELIAWERPGHEPAIDARTTDRVLRAIARLHAVPWHRALESEVGDDGASPPWCPLGERLTLLARPAATRYRDAGNPVGERFLAGWDAFDRLAPPPARDLIERLASDPGPLVRALGTLPSVGLHGDLKLANVALLDRDDVAFIDWQMTLVAPIAVDLGWLLVSNSDSLAATPDEVLARYREALDFAVMHLAGMPGRDEAGVIGDWDAQVDLTAIVGLLLRGWRKGLDTAAGSVLASGTAAEDDLDWWCEWAVEGAERRL
jgi:aminoglycoside phosphotransferase (APT) family kinase protein